MVTASHCSFYNLHTELFFCGGYKVQAMTSAMVTGLGKL